MAPLVATILAVLLGLALWELKKSREQLKKEHVQPSSSATAPLTQVSDSALLQNYIDNVPDQIYFKDLQHRFVKVNKTVAKHLNLSPDDVVGKTDADFFSPQEVKEYWEEEERIMKTGQELRDKVEKGKFIDGRQIWLSISKLPIFDRQGKIIGLLGINRDISERRKAEDELALERGLVDALMLSIPDQIYYKDRQSKFIKVNQGVVETLGAKSAESLIGKTDFDVCDEEHAKAYRADDENVMQSATPLMDRVEHGFFKGNRIWMSTTKVPVKDSSGTVIGLVGISRDITDRKQAQQKLQDLVDRAHCILWDARVKKEGERFRWQMFLHSSEVTRKEFGLEREPGESDGAMWVKRLSPETLARMNEASGEALASGATGYQQEFSFKAGDGSTRWFKEDVKINSIAPGEFHLVGVCSDITETKRAQELLMDVIARAQCILWHSDVVQDANDENELHWDFHLLSSESSDKWLGLGRNPASHGEIWSSQILPEDMVEMDKRSLGAIRQKLTGYQQEYRMRGIDGVVRWMAENVKIEVKGRNRWHLVGVVIEITQRKQIEADLKHERDLLQVLMDNIPDNIYFKDTETRFIRINTHQAQYSNLMDPSKAIGKTDFDLYPEELAREYSADEQRILKTGEGIISKVERQFVPGQPERWTLTSKVPYRDKDGKIIGIVGVSKDITALKKLEQELSAANDQLNQLARQDVLTGLLNRRMILELADTEWARWQRYGKAFSLMMIDADDFKMVNDRYGHLTGDHALRVISDCLKQSVRTVDTVGRYGGEEFMAILPETAIDGAFAAGQKILENIRSANFRHDGQIVPLSVSIGVATVTTQDKDLDALLHRADMALYGAKNVGKGRVIADGRLQVTETEDFKI